MKLTREQRKLITDALWACLNEDVFGDDRSEELVELRDHFERRTLEDMIEDKMAALSASVVRDCMTQTPKAVAEGQLRAFRWVLRELKRQ